MEPCQFSLGVFRNASEATLKSTIADQLRRHINHHRDAQNVDG
jgi:hypothetical protein